MSHETRKKAPLDVEPTHRYNEAARDHKKEGDPAGEAEDAKQALDGPERKTLKEAEKEGKAAAAERDPQVRRDYSKGE